MNVLTFSYYYYYYYYYYFYGDILSIRLYFNFSNLVWKLELFACFCSNSKFISQHLIFQDWNLIHKDGSRKFK